MNIIAGILTGILVITWVYVIKVLIKDYLNK